MLRGADEPVRLRGSPPRKEDLSMPLLPLLPLQLHQSNSSSIGLPKHNTTIGIFPLASALVASGGTNGLERLPDGQPDQAASKKRINFKAYRRRRPLKLELSYRSS